MVCRNTVLLILTILVISANGEEPRISDFRLPNTRIYGLTLSADVDKGFYQEYVEYDLWIRPYFRTLSDVTEFRTKFYIGGGRRGPYLDIGLFSSFDLRNYLFSTPLFLHGEMDIYSRNDRYLDAAQPSWENNIYGNFEIGCGIGHLREGQFVSIALYINDILLNEKIIHENLSRETILAIAKTISKKRFSMFNYERYRKYLFQEIESVLILDPALSEPIPAFTWFKIFEIVDRIDAFSFYWWSHDPEYWLRMFGTRFSIDFIASNIANYAGYDRTRFPFFDTLYYIPSVRFKFEYGKPVDLHRQISATSFYTIKWGDTIHYHNVGADFRYGYGIIDFILLEGHLSLNYNYNIPQGASSQIIFTVSPEARFSYYIEDFIEISLNGGCNFKAEKIEVPDRKYDFTANPFFGFSTDWRIF